MILEFNSLESASIKSIAVKQSDQVTLTTRFLSGEMLMFAKLSLMSFTYKMLAGNILFPRQKRYKKSKNTG